MKKFMPIIILFLMLTVPAASYGFGLELAEKIVIMMMKPVFPED